MTNWRTQGSKIYYKDQEVKIKGTNLFGWETSEKVLKGLDHHSMYDLIQNVKKLGFNAIRLPFALETVWCWDQQARQDKIKDSQDKNKTIKQLMLDMAWIMRDSQMILMIDMHRLRIDLPGGKNAITPLWYDMNEQGVSTQMVIEGWLKVAEAFKDVPNVWLSIKNEPHSDERGSSSIGTGNLATDWDKAAIQIAREIAKIKKDTIFLIMGIQIYNSSTKGQISSGWGQVLQGFLEHPLPKDLNIALEFHSYGTGVRQGYWYESKKTHQEWQREFGDVIDSQQIPCICSEFGAAVFDSSYEITDPKVCQNCCDWEYAFGDYMKSKNVSFFQWAVCGSNDSGSLLKNDWDFSKANKIKLDVCQKSCLNPTFINFL